MIGYTLLFICVIVMVIVLGILGKLFDITMESIVWLICSAVKFILGFLFLLLLISIVVSFKL